MQSATMQNTIEKTLLQCLDYNYSNNTIEIYAQSGNRVDENYVYESSIPNIGTKLSSSDNYLDVNYSEEESTSILSKKKLDEPEKKSSYIDLEFFEDSESIYSGSQDLINEKLDANLIDLSNFRTSEITDFTTFKVPETKPCQNKYNSETKLYESRMKPIYHTDSNYNTKKLEKFYCSDTIVPINTSFMCCTKFCLCCSLYNPTKPLTTKNLNFNSSHHFVKPNLRCNNINLSNMANPNCAREKSLINATSIKSDFGTQENGTLPNVKSLDMCLPKSPEISKFNTVDKIEFNYNGSNISESIISDSKKLSLNQAQNVEIIENKSFTEIRSLNFQKNTPVNSPNHQDNNYANCQLSLVKNNSNLNIGLELSSNLHVEQSIFTTPQPIQSSLKVMQNPKISKASKKKSKKKSKTYSQTKKQTFEKKISSFIPKNHSKINCSQTNQVLPLKFIPFNKNYNTISNNKHIKNLENKDTIAAYEIKRKRHSPLKWWMLERIEYMRYPGTECPVAIGIHRRYNSTNKFGKISASNKSSIQQDIQNVEETTNVPALKKRVEDFKIKTKTKNAKLIGKRLVKRDIITPKNLKLQAKLTTPKVKYSKATSKLQACVKPAILNENQFSKNFEIIHRENLNYVKVQEANNQFKVAILFESPTYTVCELIINPKQYKGIDLTQTVLLGLIVASEKEKCVLYINEACEYDENTNLSPFNNYCILPNPKKKLLTLSEGHQFYIPSGTTYNFYNASEIQLLTLMITLLRH